MARHYSVYVMHDGSSIEEYMKIKNASKKLINFFSKSYIGVELKVNVILEEDYEDKNLVVIFKNGVQLDSFYEKDLQKMLFKLRGIIHENERKNMCHNGKDVIW